MTTPHFSNCLLSIQYLYLRKKIHTLVLINSDSAWWPYHFLVLNKKGHVLHFSHILPDKWNHWAPWWFLGKYVGIRKTKQQAMLVKMHKRVCFQFTNIHFHILMAFLTCCILYPLYPIAFLLYTPAFLIYWFFHAIKHR